MDVVIMVEKILCFNPISEQEIIDFQNEILLLHNARYIFLFAKYVNGANISLLSDEIIKTNDKKYIHYFARSIKGIDYSIFIDKLIEFDDPKLLFNVIYDISELPENCFVRAALYLSSVKDLSYLNFFMYYYFCIFHGTSLLILNILNKYLLKLGINIINIDIHNVANFLENIEEKFKHAPVMVECFTDHCFKGRNGFLPDMIVCHITKDYHKAISTFYNNDSEVSSHFIVSKTGQSLQMVDLKDSAWANGTSLSEDSDVYYRFSTNDVVRDRCANANYFTFSIEHESYDGTLTEAQYCESLNIMKRIIDFVKNEYHIDFPIDRDHIVGHRELNPLVRTVCPGDNFPFDRFLNDLKKHYQNE